MSVRITYVLRREYKKSSDSRAICVWRAADVYVEGGRCVCGGRQRQISDSCAICMWRATDWLYEEGGRIAHVCINTYAYT